MAFTGTLHELIKDLQENSSAIARMGLETLPDYKLERDLQAFANQPHEKNLVLAAVEGLVTSDLTQASKLEIMVRSLLKEASFYGAFSELATYGWLLQHGFHLEPQVDFEHPNILNPGKATLDGVLQPYGAAFDIKAFGLSHHLATVFRHLLTQGSPPLRVKLEGRMDLDVKAVEKEAFGKLAKIRADLRSGKTVKIRSLSWTITPISGRPPLVTTSTHANAFRQAEELRHYPFSDASQFTTKTPFLLIFSYLPRFNSFLTEDTQGRPTTFFRSLARRVFIQLSVDSQNVNKYDRRTAMKLSKVTVGEASRLLSALLFIDLQSEAYHVFFNPRAVNPFPSTAEDFFFNHPSRPPPYADDFRYDDY
jgi:hypothetical protein